MVVDAYNEDVPVAFYKKNGFDFMFSTEEQEKSYRGIVSDKPLKTRSSSSGISPSQGKREESIPFCFIKYNSSLILTSLK